MGEWKTMESAPKKRPILAWCVMDKTDDTNCALCCPDQIKLYTTGGYRLCLYHAHGEGLSYAPTGYHIVVWGGAFDDSTHEYQGANLPDWWFVEHSEFECVANPTHWQELDPPPPGEL